MGGYNTRASVPITTQTAEEMGLHISIAADEYTIPGLVNAILEKRSFSEIKQEYEKIR